MKLAYIVMQMPSPSEVFLAVEVRGLTQLGHSVQVLSLRGPHANYAKLVNEQNLDNIELFFFPFASTQSFLDILYWLRRNPFILIHLLAVITQNCWQQPMLWLKSLALLPKSFSIARHIARVRFDAIHFAWGHYPSVTAYLLKRLMPHLTVTLALGAYDRDTHHPMTAVAANQVDCLITQSKTNVELIKNEWPCPTSPVIMIYRGVDIASHISTRNDIVKRSNMIVSVGRLIEEKGHQYLIRALPIIHQSVPTARLIIFGDGPYGDELNRLIIQLHLEHSVTLVGYRSHKDLFNAIAQAGVFALTSDRDRLPNSIKEAMVLGVPVITTPTTGIHELVKDGETGLIVPFGDVDAIAHCTVAILTDQELAGRLGSAAVRHIERFDICQTSLQRQEIYQRLIAEKRVYQ